MKYGYVVFVIGGCVDTKENHSGIYLLPNLFTTASLFAAFYAIVAAMQAHYETAVIAIFVGMLSDGLDGRVARLTNTQTAFGAQYDSLSDMVTFGVAPSLLLYSWLLHGLGKIGWLVAFTYTAAVALRLARFNTKKVDKRYFQGLSCPAAAALVSAYVWLCQPTQVPNTILINFTAILAVVLALLMVSNIRYYSFKEIDFKGKVPFIYLLLVVIAFVFIAANPAIVLLVIFVSYALSGPVWWLWTRYRWYKKTKMH